MTSLINPRGTLMDNSTTDGSGIVQPYAYNFQNVYNYGYETKLYGYVWPSLGLTVLILNILMIVVFIRTRMSSTTHMYLAAITTLDTLTIIFPSIVYFHVFVVLDIDDYLPYNLCKMWYYFTDIFPVTFHASAILITVCLAGQRCLCAAYPLSVAQWFTTKVTFVSIVGCILIAVIFEVSEFILYTFDRVDIFRSNETISGCKISIGRLETDEVRKYQISHFIVRVAIFELIPCVILIILDIIMLRKVHQAQTWRKSSSSNLQKSRRRNSSVTSTSTRLTILTLWFVGVFLIVEIPVVIILSIYAAGMLLSKTIVPLNELYTASVFSNFLVMLSFPLNFFIYFCCSKAFRVEAIRLLTCRVSRKSKMQRNAFDSVFQRTISSQIDHANPAFQN
ncbi:probable G-protein coupled receptor AH9.1 [Mytilus californianus]|uniref:probable G-protein coupled receptor AH9.1 n=1 Tax=Mytilus californianus TaxID=6549 RepID=UPI002247174D|nr:probable G-protein coupled receptor AH9.1 [Mytilus californianus]